MQPHFLKTWFLRKTYHRSSLGSYTGFSALIGRAEIPDNRSLIFSDVNIFVLPSSSSVRIVSFLFKSLSLTFHFNSQSRILSCMAFSDSVLQHLYLELCPQNQRTANAIPGLDICSCVFAAMMLKKYYS